MRIISLILLAISIVAGLTVFARSDAQVESAKSHSEWIAQSLREMETIKVGMTRADLLKVFTEEGGLSTRTQRQYVYRECPYIKVAVEFEPVGTTAVLPENGKDKIVTDFPTFHRVVGIRLKGSKLMKQILIVIVLVVASCVLTPAQTTPDQPHEKGDTEQVILRLESEGREATLKNDIAANDRLLADNWMNVNPDGSITTKAKLLELLKDGSFKIMSIENDEVMVRVYGEGGDAAVVTGRSTTKRAGPGGEVLARQVRFTRVYVKSKGQWQVVSAHNTLIAKP